MEGRLRLGPRERDGEYRHPLNTRQTKSVLSVARRARRQGQCGDSRRIERCWTEPLDGAFSPGKAIRSGRFPATPSYRETPQPGKHLLSCISSLSWLLPGPLLEASADLLSFSAPFPCLANLSHPARSPDAPAFHIPLLRPQQFKNYPPTLPLLPPTAPPAATPQAASVPFRTPSTGKALLAPAA